MKGKDVIRKVCWNYDIGNLDVPVSVVIPLHHARANQNIAQELGTNKGARIVYGYYHSLDGSNGYSFFPSENLTLAANSDTTDKKQLTFLLATCEAFFEEQQKQLNRRKKKIRALEKQAQTWDET